MTKKQNNENNIEIYLPLTEIQETQQKDAVRSFLPSPFIAASLPLKDIKKPSFVRKYNKITLRLNSAIKVPFGRYGRLLLTILTTYAVLGGKKAQEQGVLINYKSIRQLLDEMQLSPGRNNEIKEQLECFSNATFSFEERRTSIVQKKLFKDMLADGDYVQDDTLAVTKVTTGIIPFMEGMQYFEVDNGKKDLKQYGIVIKLSPAFVRFSQAHSVPINYTVYKKITSAVGKDLYAWLIYRNNSITEPLTISREAIVNQFMPVTENANRNQERINFNYIKEQICLIKRDFYPELQVSFGKDNMSITFYKSKAQIEANDTRYVLVTAMV